jgi:mono/diheme cytochrome c family protein
MRALAFAVIALMHASAAWGQGLASMSEGWVFQEQGGEALYAHVCAACHQPDGRGAVGAGAYPALVDDKNVASATYVMNLLLNGQRAMPAVGQMMSDAQTADVINYVRARFGDVSGDEVSAADVKAARPAAP